MRVIVPKLGIKKLSTTADDRFGRIRTNHVGSQQLLPMTGMIAQYLPRNLNNLLYPYTLVNHELG